MAAHETAVAGTLGGARRNLVLLFIAQSIIGAQLPLHIILGGLTGALLAPDRSLATLPVSVVVLFSMFTAPLASAIMGRYGRKTGFLLGTLAGFCAAAATVAALRSGSFSLLLTGSACFGVAQAIHGFFRFAAADTVVPALQPRAISIIFVGGLVSAILGPELVQQFSDALAPVQYAGAYLAVFVTNLVGAAAVMLLKMPALPGTAASAGSIRPLRVILADRQILTAIICGTVAYAIMSLVMTSTPLAMVATGLTSDHAADVVRWHVIAMFAPSFFTGPLISRFGHSPIIGTGLVLLGVCCLLALAGIELHHFYAALVMLGVGWNFGFVGATSLLAASHLPEEKARVQGINDFFLFGIVACASFSSGALLSAFGWNAVQLAAFPAILLALGLLLSGRRRVRLTAAG